MAWRGGDNLYGRAGNDSLSGGDGNDYLYGEEGDDTLQGDAGDDTLSGGNGADVLRGGDGIDALYGDAGNDTLDGGVGNDILYGGAGNNTYLFGRSDGLDSIRSLNDSTAGKLNTLQFKSGVVVADVLLKQVTDAESQLALEISIVGTTDKITINSFFRGENPSNTYNPIQQIKFNDGTTWDLATITANAFLGTAAADTLTGTADNNVMYGLVGGDNLAGRAGNDTLSGGDGNDYLYGEEGDDTLQGDAGDDTLSGGNGADVLRGGNGIDALYGDAGNDVLQGDAGNDILYGGAGNDTLDGGAGNDTLSGDAGNNTYFFGRGDGQDTIRSFNDATVGKLSTLQLKAGILSSDVQLRQTTDSETGTNTALELAILGTTDKITINSFFRTDNPSNAYNQLQQIKFNDGTTWDLATITANAFLGTSSADTQYGTDDNNAMYGLAGSDSLYGRAGNDTMSGGDGNDYLYGEEGDDTLQGDAGDDTLSGGNGADVLRGGDGIDALYGDAGNDVLQGDAGNDILYGGAGNNTYLFGRGDGQDSIRSLNDSTAGKLNTLQFKSGVAVADVLLKQVYDSESQLALEISIAGTTDKITINSFFREENPSNTYNPIQQIKFNDGTTWDLPTIIANAFPGTSAADTQTGTADNNIMLGLAGADTLFGRTGNDSLSGGADNDSLYGESGNDTLDGGAGNDTLNGGVGNDTYLFGLNSGADTLNDYDSTASNTDVLSLMAGVSENQMWFRRVNADLEVSIIGTTDKVTIQNWYTNSNYHVEQFKTADNKVLLDTQVDNLVSAMAAFAPPAAGQTTLPSNYQTSLNTVIAANWK